MSVQSGLAGSAEWLGRVLEIQEHCGVAALAEAQGCVEPHAVGSSTELDGLGQRCRGRTRTAARSAGLGLPAVSAAREMPKTRPRAPLSPRGPGALRSQMARAALTTPRTGSSETKTAKVVGRSDSSLNQAWAAARQAASGPPIEVPMASKMTARRHTRACASSRSARRTDVSRQAVPSA